MGVQRLSEPKAIPFFKAVHVSQVRRTHALARAPLLQLLMQRHHFFPFVLFCLFVDPLPRKVAARADQVAVITTDGRMLTWGWDPLKAVMVPAPSPLQFSGRVLQIALGSKHAAALVDEKGAASVCVLSLCVAVCTRVYMCVLCSHRCLAVWRVVCAATHGGVATVASLVTALLSTAASLVRDAAQFAVCVRPISLVLQHCRTYVCIRVCLYAYLSVLLVVCRCGAFATRTRPVGSRLRRRPHCRRERRRPSVRGGAMQCTAMRCDGPQLTC